MFCGISQFCESIAIRMKFILSLFVLIISNDFNSSSENNFICKSGHLLNGIHLICDGHADCYDASDESTELCAPMICPDNYFKCYYGACVHRSKKCNGIRDCVDGSDEQNCGKKINSCAAHEFHCGYPVSSTTENFNDDCIESSKLCDGVWNCDNGADESKAMCERFLCPKETFRCKYGGCVAQSTLCDGFNDCFDGTDESAIICFSLKCPKCSNTITCPSIAATAGIQFHRIDATCLWNDRTISCSNILPGTTMTYRCKDHYRPQTAQDSNNDWNLCQADGTWLRDFLKCEPVCGRLTQVIPLITNGWSTAKTLPWHASLYIAENNKKESITFVCGGTLISEAVIITAAHCVWRIKTEDLRIVIGNSKLNYGDYDDFTARHFSAKQIITHPVYVDRLGNYGSDIALIQLDDNVELDDYILPICIDWNFNEIMSYEHGSPSVGIVAGFGLTINLTFSDNMQIASMPIVSNEQCIDGNRSDFRKYITVSTFCAGWANGTNTCNGDSGAGLVFPMINVPDRYFLRGIVSLSQRKLFTDHCDPEQYTIFTKVDIYMKWIENVLNNINAQRPISDANDDDSNDNTKPIW